MRFQFVKGFFVGVQTSAEPPGEAWQAHCAAVERVRHELRGVLVYTLGGGPDSKQRQLLRGALHELQPPPVAIMTASPLVRGIVTGFNWFLPDPRIVAFALNDIEGALGYLARRGALPRDEILGTMGALANELGVKLEFLPIPNAGTPGLSA